MEKKPSKLQQEVIDLLKNGWSLAQSSKFITGSCWMQEGRMGHGGKSKKISATTVRSLRINGFIVEDKSVDDFRRTEYILNPEVFTQPISHLPSK